MQIWTVLYYVISTLFPNHPCASLKTLSRVFTEGKKIPFFYVVPVWCWEIKLMRKRRTCCFNSWSMPIVCRNLHHRDVLREPWSWYMNTCSQQRISTGAYCLLAQPNTDPAKERQIKKKSLSSRNLLRHQRNTTWSLLHSPVFKMSYKERWSQTTKYEKSNTPRKPPLHKLLLQYLSWLRLICYTNFDCKKAHPQQESAATLTSEEILLNKK